jgi:hypothetical protein
MTTDDISKGSTIVYIDKSFENVIEKMNIYIGLAKKFINKHKRYQYIKYVEQVPGGDWCLVFKILPSNHEAVKEYNNIKNNTKKEMWVKYISNYIKG